MFQRVNLSPRLASSYDCNESDLCVHFASKNRHACRLGSLRYTSGFLVACLGIGALSCTSGPKLENLDTQLEKKGSTPTESVGIDSSGKAVVQKQSSASARLVTLEHVNENMKLDLRQHFFLLRECRESLALSEHGGSGEYPELTDFETLEAQYEKKSQLGLEKGDLKVVETSDLQERIAAQEAFQKELAAFIRTVKKEHDKCAFALRERKALRHQDRPARDSMQSHR